MCPFATPCSGQSAKCAGNKRLKVGKHTPESTSRDSSLSWSFSRWILVVNLYLLRDSHHKSLQLDQRRNRSTRPPKSRPRRFEMTRLKYRAYPLLIAAVTVFASTGAAWRAH